MRRRECLWLGNEFILSGRNVKRIILVKSKYLSISAQGQHYIVLKPDYMSRTDQKYFVLYWKILFENRPDNKPSFWKFKTKCCKQWKILLELSAHLKIWDKIIIREKYVCFFALCFVWLSHRNVLFYFVYYFKK